MSYRTNVNGTQIFGNNEWYGEWGEYLISKGIKISDEGLYDEITKDEWIAHNGYIADDELKELQIIWTN